MRINHREIGPDRPPYIIAEMGASHNGSAYTGKLLIDAIKDAGCDAVKLQCYTASEICIKGKTKVESETWRDQNLYELYQKAETPRALVSELYAYATKLGIDCFSSVFSFDGADFVKNLGMPAVKIASFELIDTPLIEYCAQLGFPMIISTGMGSGPEITSAINAYNAGSRKYGWESHNLALLHCVSAYPAKPSQANLPFLGPLSTFCGGNHVVGYSDHTLGVGTAAGSVAYGASIIEKHVKLDTSNDLSNPDASFCLLPDALRELVVACRETWEATRPSKPPVPNVAYRKGLWVVKKVPSGTPFSRENVQILRPASSLAPSAYALVLGSVASRDLEAGTPLHASMVAALCSQTPDSQDREQASSGSPN